MPWAECIDPVTKCFLPKEELQKKFEQININKNSTVVFSCGSGVTACILAKAFEVIDGKNSRFMMGHGLNGPVNK